MIEVKFNNIVIQSFIFFLLGPALMETRMQLNAWGSQEVAYTISKI